MEPPSRTPIARRISKRKTGARQVMKANVMRILVLALGAGAAGAALADVKLFEPLPPVWRVVPEHVPEAPKERPFNIAGHTVDALVIRRVDNALKVRGQTLARDINSLGEVPDSAWFENRIGHRPLTPEDIYYGPTARDGSSAPPPGDKLVVVSGKVVGRNPGFMAKDSRGQRYLVEFDPERLSEAWTGASVVGNRLFWAFGFHVPEDSLVVLRREQLGVDEDSEIKVDGTKRPMTEEDLDAMLAGAPLREDGSYRIFVSRFLPGKPIGPFSQDGVRKDDPNDRIPHEDRRSLRAMRVIAAWLNHTDIKEGNTLDVYVTEGEKSFVRHYLIDFDHIFGGIAGQHGDLSDGYEYRFDPEGILVSMLSLGLYVKPFERIRHSGYTAIGPFSADPFDFYNWKPALPNRYMNRMNDLDALWGVRKLLAITPEHLRAAIRAAHYSEPGAPEHLFDVLWQRRQKIAQAVLGRVNPVDGFELADGGRALDFVDLGVEHGVADPASASWLVQLGVRGAQGELLQPAVHLAEPRIALPPLRVAPGEQAVVRIQALREGRRLGDPTHVHLVPVRGGQGWRIVGIDRWRTGSVDVDLSPRELVAELQRVRGVPAQASAAARR
jgi:hypothetical protein